MKILRTLFTFMLLLFCINGNVYAANETFSSSETVNLAPTRIWWEIVVEDDHPPYYRYAQRYEVGQIYVGYLAIIRRIYPSTVIYGGYLYPAGNPLPIPAKQGNITE